MVVHAKLAIDASAKMIGELKAKIGRLGLSRISALIGTLDADWVVRSTHFRAPFDLVVCSSVCAFLDDYAGSVEILARQLRPGGLFVQWDWELDPNAEEPFGLTRKAIREALEGAGLTPISVDIGFTIEERNKSMSPLMGVGLQPRNLPVV